MEHEQSDILINKLDNKLFVNFKTDITISDFLQFENEHKNIQKYELFNNRTHSNIKFNSDLLDILHNTSFKKSNQFISLYELIRNEINKYSSVCNQIILTGHGVGGAVACLFYFIYKLDNLNTEDKISNIKTITYGSPNFVTEEHASEYESVCPDLIRIFNRNDLFAYLPLNYVNVGDGLCLDDSNIQQNNINSLLLDILRLEKMFLLLLVNMQHLNKQKQI